MDLEKIFNKKENIINVTKTYSMRVKTKDGLVIYSNLQIVKIPEDEYWNEDEFDYGDKLE